MHHTTIKIKNNKWLLVSSTDKVICYLFIYLLSKPRGVPYHFRYGSNPHLCFVVSTSPREFDLVRNRIRDICYGSSSHRNSAGPYTTEPTLWVKSFVIVLNDLRSNFTHIRNGRNLENGISYSYFVVQNSLDLPINLKNKIKIIIS